MAITMKVLLSITNTKTVTINNVWMLSACASGFFLVTVLIFQKITKLLLINIAIRVNYIGSNN